MTWLMTNAVAIGAACISLAALIVAWRSHRARAFRPVWTLTRGMTPGTQQSTIRFTNRSREVAQDVMAFVGREYLAQEDIEDGESFEVIAGHDVFDEHVWISWKTPGGRSRSWPREPLRKKIARARAAWPRRGPLL